MFEIHSSKFIVGDRIIEIGNKLYIGEEYFKKIASSEEEFKKFLGRHRDPKDPDAEYTIVPEVKWELI